MARILIGHKAIRFLDDMQNWLQAEGHIVLRSRKHQLLQRLFASVDYALVILEEIEENRAWAEKLRSSKQLVLTIPTLPMKKDDFLALIKKVLSASTI